MKDERPSQSQRLLTCLSDDEEDMSPPEGGLTIDDLARVPDWENHT